MSNSNFSSVHQLWVFNHRQRVENLFRSVTATKTVHTIIENQMRAFYTLVPLKRTTSFYTHAYARVHTLSPSRTYAHTHIHKPRVYTYT